MHCRRPMQKQERVSREFLGRVRRHRKLRPDLDPAEGGEEAKDLGLDDDGDVDVLGDRVGAEKDGSWTRSRLGVRGEFSLGLPSRGTVDSWTERPVKGSRSSPVAQMILLSWIITEQSCEEVAAREKKDRGREGGGELD